MIVLKFGGTSVANAENMHKAVAIVKDELKRGNQSMMVVSALSKATDKLIAMAKLAAKGDMEFQTQLIELKEQHFVETKALLPVATQSSALSRVMQLFNELEAILEGVFAIGELSPRTQDRVMSFGEILSSTIISHYLASEQVVHEWVDSRAVIRTNSRFGNAQVDMKATTTLIKEHFDNSKYTLHLLPGFIASDEEGSITTLGRGGSDYTAAILAAALDAQELQIWTDVSGMMTADPRICSNAKVIPNISYQEAMELSHFGAKVIYPPTIQPVMSKGIPVRIKNTFAPADAGTLIEPATERTDSIACGLSSMGNIALLQLEGSGMIGIPGFSRRLFETLASEKINVILITQSSSEHSICIAVDEHNAAIAKRSVDEEFAYEISTQRLQPLQVEADQSIIALVGDHMKSHTGISGRMFSALGKNGVNIRAIAQGASEKNISVVIKSSDVRKAINVLHEDFFEETKKLVNLFIVGVGNVGSRLLEQLESQRQFLQNKLRVQINVVGIANSKKMLFKEEGISLPNWKEELDKAEPMNQQTFGEFIIQKNLRNSVFVDNTANENVPKLYDSLLRKSVSIVACNKIAASSSYSNYKSLKDLATEFNTQFFFETNVGAGLPVIGTLSDLRSSGDEIVKIQAVLSGTLNFVFNNYNGEKSFTDVVKQAQAEGYTEPDPRIDLSGVDVMRKILILAREAGFALEMEDVTCNGFLPEECMKGSVDDFYKELPKHEAHFKSLYDAAAAKQCRLKFVATLDNGKASVGLQQIDSAHDLYHLYGKDNVVIFHTKRYSQQPLVIKGAGAGAEVTASGIFADIMRAARS